MVNLMEEACRIIIEDIINGKITTRRELEVEKRQLCRDRNLKKFMSNIYEQFCNPRTCKP